MDEIEKAWVGLPLEVLRLVSEDYPAAGEILQSFAVYADVPALQNLGDIHNSYRNIRKRIEELGNE